MPQLLLTAKEGAGGQSADGRDTVAPYSRSFQRTMVGTILNAPDEGMSLVIPAVQLLQPSFAASPAVPALKLSAPPGVGRTHPASWRLGADRAGGWCRRVCLPGSERRVLFWEHPGMSVLSCFNFRLLFCSTWPSREARQRPNSILAWKQVMVTKEVAEAVGSLKALIPSGTSVLVEGELTETPPGTKQVVSQPIQSHPSLRPTKDAVCVAETGTPVGLVPLYISAGHVMVSLASLAS